MEEMTLNVFFPKSFPSSLGNQGKMQLSRATGFFAALVLLLGILLSLSSGKPGFSWALKAET